MVKPRCKSKSKRMSCSLKYRIRKNVANHNKKQKKQAKKNFKEGRVKQIKKDLGVPNSAPFKEEVLREAELQKQIAEEVRLRKREEQRNGIKTKTSLHTIKENALESQKIFELKETMMEKLSKCHNVSMLSSDTSKKAYYKEFRKVVETADVIIEVLDARDPLGCRCREVEKSILDSNATKKIVLLLNKIDLVPKKNVEAWIKYLSGEYPTVAFKAATQTQKDTLAQCKIPLKHLKNQIISNTTQCVGAGSLFKLISNYCKVRDQETPIVVGVVGYPNVGKRSVINSLRKAKSSGVGSTSFIKSMKDVVICKNIKVLDSPGIVMATGDGNNEASVVLRNCVKVEALTDSKPAVEEIINRCNNEQLMMKYNIESFSDVDQFLMLIAKRYGKLKKGGRPNINQAAKQVLNDWNSGKISYYTHPPQNKVVTNATKIATNVSPEFDWKLLDEDNKHVLANVMGNPSISHSVLLQQPVITNQLMETDLLFVEMENNLMDFEESTIDLGKMEGKTSSKNVTANEKLENSPKLKKGKEKKADKLGGDKLSAFETNNEMCTQPYNFDDNMDN